MSETSKTDDSFSATVSVIDHAANSFKKDDRYNPPQLPHLYETLRMKALEGLGVVEGYDIPEFDGDYPLWYQVVSLFIRRFPWRFAFVIAVILMGVNDYSTAQSASGSADESMGTILDTAFSMFLSGLFLVVLVLVNTIFGIFTNLIRTFLYIFSEKLLRWHLFLIAKKSIKKQIQHAQSSNQQCEMSGGEHA